jgi:GxxExxY protein
VGAKQLWSAADDKGVMIDDPVSENVIGACIEVHRHLGPGLLEATYEECVCHELAMRGVTYKRQFEQPVVYKGLELASVYRLDLVVEDRIIVELKSVDVVLPVHYAQLSTYLRVTPFDVGLLINFNVSVLKQGIRRFTKSTHNFVDLPLISKTPISQ